MRRLAAVFAVFGVLMACIGGVILCKSKSSTATHSATTSQGLFCPNPVVDIGETGKQEIRQTFELTNQSPSPIRIKALRKSCSCLRVDLSKPIIAPGETATVAMLVDILPRTPGARTPFSERILVQIQGDESPSLALWVRGVYTPPAYSTLRQVTIVAPGEDGEHYEAEFEFFVNRDGGTECTGVNAEGALKFQARIKRTFQVERDPYERIVVGITGTTPKLTSPARGDLVLRLSSKDFPAMRVPVVLIPGTNDTVTFDCDVIAFGVLTPVGKVSRQVTARWPDSVDCAVKAAYTTDKGVTVRIGDIRQEERYSVLPIECEIDTNAFKGVIAQSLVVELCQGTHVDSHRLPISGFVKAQ
jgi:hypothetical protein